MDADKIILGNASTTYVLKQKFEDTQEFKNRVEEVKKMAKQKGGKILRSRRFSDGHFLEVFFMTNKAKKEWESFMVTKNGK